MELELTGKKVETADVYTFLFKSKEPIQWTAGQYLRYKIPHANPDGEGVIRYFTIASTPFEGTIRLTCRIPETGVSTFKAALKNLAIGSTVEAEGPRGSFTLEDPTLTYVFIAGGIGITPFRAILLDLDSKNLPLNITLLYANRTNDIVFKTELEALTNKHNSFKVRYFISPERVNEESIRQSVPDPFIPYFYVSGPEPMVVGIEDVLEKMGVGKERIKHDYFPGYTAI